MGLWLLLAKYGSKRQKTVDTQPLPKYIQSNRKLPNERQGFKTSVALAHAWHLTRHAYEESKQWLRWKIAGCP